MTRAGLWGFLFVLLFAVAGCGAAAKEASASPGQANYSASGARATAADSDEVAIMEEAPAEPMAAPAPPPARAPMADAPAAGGVSASASDKARAEPVAKHAPPPGTFGQPATAGQPAQAAQPAKPAVASQLLIYTANVRVRVQEVPKAIDAVEKLAKERGGYLVLREDSQITVRVPSAKFDATLDELVKLGEVVHRNVSIEDVTDLYFDMQIRMKNLEVVMKRLEELLEKAKTVEESLAVQRQIERVTIELERMRGKLKLIAELVLFSTITVVFEPKSTEQIDSKVRLPFPWMDRLGLGDLLRL
jgi:hypothetical protein